MSSTPDKHSKTEKPTAQRLRKARSEGQVARSSELGSWVMLSVASFLIPLYIRYMATSAAKVFSTLKALPPQPGLAELSGLGSQAFKTLAVLVAIPLLSALLVGVFSSVAQTGLVFAPKAVQPKLSNLSWKKGLKKSFSKKTVWETAKQLTRLSIVALIAAPLTYATIKDLAVPGLSLGPAFSLALGRITLLVQLIAITGFLLSLVDFAFQKRSTLNDLKMTKQEIKQESKNNDGDPLLKARRRQVAAELSQNRMLASVATSSVVVVNPVHFAVALHYDTKLGVPVVTARGSEEQAIAIRDEALAAGVPVVECIPLARQLHRTSRKGKTVPPEMYAPVAVLIAFTRRLGSKRSLPIVHRLDPRHVGLDTSDKLRDISPK